MRGHPAVYRTANGSVYVEQADGSFLVVRLDGGTETRFDLPGSAVALDTCCAEEDAA